MKPGKRLLALCLALLLLAVTPCALAHEEGKELPRLTEETQTLKVMLYVRDIDNYVPETLWSVQHLEEMTNVHIEYQVVANANWTNQLNLMYASSPDEYPDIVVGGTVDAEMYGVDQHVYIPLNDLIDQYMPNYKALLEAYPDTCKSLVASDGNYYAVGRLADGNAPVAGDFLTINQTWLNELGLPMPTSLDELTQTLQVFKAAHPDVYPYTSIFTEMVNCMAQLWGIPQTGGLYYSISDEGEVYLNAQQPGYRGMVEYLHSWYELGLMDPETLTQDTSTCNTRLTDGNVGFADIWRTLSVGLDGMIGNQVLWEPVAAEGYEVKVQWNMPLATPCVFITSACKNPELAARWIDAQLEPQYEFESYYGPEDTLWYWDEDGRCNLKGSDQTGTQYCLGVNGIYYWPGEYYNTIYLQPDFRLERSGWCEALRPYYVKYSNSYINNLSKKTAEITEEEAFLLADIKACVDEATADFIMHGVTDDSWNSFQQNLTNIGAERYIRIQQEAFDNTRADLGI
ncbi:MAG: hypothetical protein ACI4ML_01970 [Aristaeellaceae bacterium]